MKKTAKRQEGYDKAKGNEKLYLHQYDLDILNEMISQLTNDPGQFKKVKKQFKMLFPKTVAQHLELLFKTKLTYGYKARTLREKCINDIIRQRSRNGRRADKIFRINEELEHARKNDWFVIFSTYTFRDERDCKKFNEDKGFNRWKVQIDRAVMYSCGLKDWKDRRGKNTLGLPPLCLCSGAGR